ncbi:uncharacterized protein LOC123894603 [Trifolium pratense]|uniref:uncharacterized protein LOC123894603 n=1 Tax=Trifolium pratense TaxID=57577 RepID=UPI001E69245A|nr:uncharacterized protein LOC123894603 [Trifolium pratense]
MSDSAKSTPINDEATRSQSAMGMDSLVVNAIPLSSIPPISPTKKVKKTSKKEKTSQVSLNSSSPSASIKKTKKKSKKSKTESRRNFTMSELHVDPLPSSGVATPVINPAEENVDASGKNPLNLGLDVSNSVETLDVENPAVSENLGKSVPNPPITVDANIGASIETNDDVAAESLKKTGHETHAASSVVTPDAEPNVVSDVTTSLAPENLVDYSESDESLKHKSADEEIAVDKDVNENPDVVIVNETTVSDKSVPINSEASVARRTRSRAGKGVAPRTEEKGKAKKRKAPPTSDSEFEPETDVAASGSTSRKSIGRKKVPQFVPYAPLDNVSFHLENGFARWKFVYHRRLALERNLKEDILQC